MTQMTLPAHSDKQLQRWGHFIMPQFLHKSPHPHFCRDHIVVDNFSVFIPIDFMPKVFFETLPAFIKRLEYYFLSFIFFAAPRPRHNFPRPS